MHDDDDCSKVPYYQNEGQHIKLIRCNLRAFPQRENERKEESSNLSKIEMP